MRIAVNTRHLLRDRLEGIGTVTHEVMKRIVRDHPEDQFDYFFDRKNPTGIYSWSERKGLFFLSTYQASYPFAILVELSCCKTFKTK